MNKSQAEKKILEALETKRGSMHVPNHPGRFLTILAHDISATGTRDRSVIIEALESLENKSKLELQRVGKQIVGMTKVRVKHIDRTDCSPELHRQSRHAVTAEGHHIPSRLPDHLVGPLHVRVDPSAIKVKKESPSAVPTQRQAEESEATVVEAPATEPPEEAKPIYQTGDRFHETLTSCLHALRVMANPDGVSDEGVGVRQVLLAHGLNDSQAGNVMDYLRGMSLYTAAMTGFQKSTYQVALEPAEVTIEMVREQRAIFAAKNCNAPKKETPSETAQQPEAPNVINPLDKLAEIIVGLEAQGAELTKERDGLKRKLKSLEKRYEDRKAAQRRDKERIAYRDQKLAEARAEITRLQTELDNLQNQQPAVSTSSLAAEVLGRYS